MLGRVGRWRIDRSRITHLSANLRDRSNRSAVPTYRTTTVRTAPIERIDRFIAALSQQSRLCRACHAHGSRRSNNSRGDLIVKIKVFAVKGRRNIAGQLAAIELAMIRRQDRLLDLLPAVGVDRMRNVGMQLQTTRAVTGAVR